MSATEPEMGISRSDGARLADFVRVATRDVGEAAEQIGRIFCPHDLKPRHAQATGFHARHNCAALDGISINYVAYGGSVTIDPGCLERFFLVQVPLEGAARIRTGGRDFTTRPSSAASLLSPTVPTRMVWEDCAQAILLLDRRMVEQRAAALSGKAVCAIEFDPVVDLGAPAGQSLTAMLGELLALAERLGPAGRLSPAVAADWRETLLDHLLNGQPHGLSDAIRTFSGCAERLPRALRTARDWLEANAAEPLDLAQLASSSGIGIRALQLGFRRHSACRSRRCCSTSGLPAFMPGCCRQHRRHPSRRSPSISASAISAAWPAPTG